MTATETTPRILGMRDAYFEALYPKFAADECCVFLTADNGAPSMDRYAELPGRFKQVGISEQHMVSMACGLALEGHRVVIYSIAAFVLRALEAVKVNMCAQNLPITWVGVGSGLAYDIMGPTHHACGLLSSLRWMPNLTVWQPADAVTARALAERGIADGPEVILFDRTLKELDIYGTQLDTCGLAGLIWAKLTRNIGVTIIASGVMVHQAIKVAGHISQCSVIDAFRIQPIDCDGLEDMIDESRLVVTLEEDYLDGGLGSQVAEAFSDRGIKTPLLRIGLKPEFNFEMGGREVLWKKHGLDVESVVNRIKERLQR